MNQTPTYRDFACWAAQTADRIVRDCNVDVFHGHGPGGQGVNTADSAVRMTHVPSGIAVTSRESRSQFRNRQLCVAKLREVFRAKSIPPKTRRATRPGKAARQRRLDAKHARSRTKQMRTRVDHQE